VNTRQLHWFRELFLLWLLLPTAAFGQVAADGTLTTTISTPDELNFTIEAGNQVGGNLFHSFRSFSIPTGGSANFNNAANVQNIIGRVTGGSVSHIDGLIRANGTANLFLINPSGVVFGQNASLNIGGSFIGSTANSIQFADGTEFSAVNLSAPLLTISVPVGLQVGTTPGAIRVQGAGNNLALDADGIVLRDVRPVGLEVPVGHTLALVGGELSLEGGNLTAPAGRIELGSVAGGTVYLNPIRNNWVLDYRDVVNFQDIQLRQAASVDTSGAGGGAIHLQGRSIFLKEGSAVLGYTLGNQSGEDSIVQATKAVELSGTNAFGVASFLGTRVDPDAIAPAGNVFVETERLLLQDGAIVSSSTFGRSNSGNLTIRAAEVVLSGVDASGLGSSLLTQVAPIGVGNAGNLTIETGQLRIQDGATVSAITFGRGNSGNLTIRASKTVELSGSDAEGLGSSLTTEVRSGGIGNAGNLTIETGQLLLRDGTTVSSDTFGRGNSGNVTIRASEAVELSGLNAGGEGSFLTTQVAPRAVGNAGDLTIETERLRIWDGAVIAPSTFGRGNGGNLTIRASEAIELGGSDGQEFASLLTTQVAPTGVGNAGNLTIETRQVQLQDGAQLSSSVFGQGKGGNLTIKATDFVQLSGRSLRGSTALGTNVGPRGQGDAGNLTVETGHFILQNGAFVTSATRGAGNAGNLVVRAKDSVLVDRAVLSARTEGGGQAGNLVVTTDRFTVQNGGQLIVSGQGQFPAGNLTVNANSIRLNNQASLRAETEVGDRGSIFLNAQDIFLRQNSTITTNATSTATGGNITVKSDVLVLAENSAIVAQAILGRGGNITIMTQGLFQLPGTRIDASSELGINGTVQLNTPDIDPRQQVVALPDAIVDSAQLIANSCLVPSVRRQGTFVLAGVGGLPSVPTSPLRSPFQTYTIPTNTATSAQTHSSPQLKPLIAEAQGIYPLESGGLMLGWMCR
jgi:filamentous hemagglutinin family protein